LKNEIYFNVTDSVLKKFTINENNIIFALNKTEKKKYIKINFKENKTKETLDYSKNLHYTV
jgi:hypothetical protein